MITQTNIRKRSGEDELKQKPFTRSIKQAFNSLVNYEIGYGGIVISIEETKVVVETRIMDTIDTTIYEGTKEDMALLVEAALLCVRIGREHGSTINEMVADDLIKKSYGVTLAIKMAAGMFIGKTTSRIIMYTMLNIDDKYINDADAMSNEDLLAMLLLVRLDGIRYEEILGVPV